MKKILILILGIGLIACAKKDAEKAEANKNLEQTDKLTQEQIKCDGEGTAFSGSYLLESEIGVVTCSKDDEKEEFPAMALELKCVQNNADLACTGGSDDSMNLKGCINKDGSFALASNLFLGSDIAQKLEAEFGGTSEQATLINGKLAADQATGTIKMTIQGNPKKGSKISCNWDCAFTMQRTEDVAELQEKTEEELQ